jgi:dTDP-4-dehydrorhamnose reductase
VPIATSEYPTAAQRPLNSRLDLRRLRDVFGLTMPTWDDALAQALVDWPSTNTAASAKAA